ncbi:MAG: copper resistance system multicopper oxidase [Gallionellaceae bacterium]|jgi:FtsP/CotA-like multicopper oxidase with cupredoxin domain
MNRMMNPEQTLSDMPRRKFLEGLVAGGIVMGLAPWSSIFAAPGDTHTTPVLSGTEFDLSIGEAPANFTGKARIATTVNGSIPAPTLHWREGETVTIRVKNNLKVDSSIHWHGIILDAKMDGVPGISFMGIAPGTTFTYRFKVNQAGTYWYHSHSGFQEQQGMYGAIVIEPAGGEKIKADRDYVVTLSDWTDEDPMRVLKKLKMQGDYYNYHQPTAIDFVKDVAKVGLSVALDERKMWNEMRMSPMDLADVSAATYTYLMNGTAPAGNWTGIFKPGEKVRLRFINSAGMSFFDVRIPGLKMTVIQADGQDVEPVTVDEFRIGVAETYDVIVTPGDEAYTIFAQSMDRTGYARGTLATRAGLAAAIPALDKAEPLSMGDMMGDMVSGGVRHAKTEYGPSVDMRVDTPRSNIDDPGVGLRYNNRHVLTYADLKSLGGIMGSTKADMDIELHLTGNMERYTWSIDGVEFGKSTPVHFPYGKRVRVIFVNDTMMSHPMHLHGMWSDLENPEGGLQVRKHTIVVQPAQRVSFLVTADALGRWAWHCHLMYHMDTGMFREVVVA